MKYEYCTITRYFTKNHNDVVEFLNSMGAKNWKLVFVTKDDLSQHTFWLMREIKGKKKNEKEK